MHARTAAPGDGRWQPVAASVRDGRAAVYTTTIHPHPIKSWIHVVLVAFDRERIALRLVAGTGEPSTESVAPEHRTGLVPAADQPRLIAVFNGGFMRRHGKYGMWIDGVDHLPPRDDACAVAIDKSERVRIGSYTRIAEDAAELRAWRQTPPCLVERRELEPRLRAEERWKRWGAAEGGKLDIRRSALALHGRALVYAFGDWVTARELAQALHHAGVTDAAELDINWSFTRFFFVEHDADGPRLGPSLVPKVKASAERYLRKPSERDFFYVVWR
jgi:hypothetical protein